MSETTAIIIQEAARLLGILIKSRPVSVPYPESISQEIPAPAPVAVPPVVSSENIAAKATGVKSGCIPCSLGHYGTCSGLLNEGVRFVRADGMTGEVSTRINMCLDELNSLERVDLRPEMLVGLEGWERELAERTLDASRETRHGLEAVQTPEDVINLAAKVQAMRTELGKEYYAHKWQTLTPAKQQEIREKLKAAAAKETESNAPVSA